MMTGAVTGNLQPNQFKSLNKMPPWQMVIDNLRN